MQSTIDVQIEEEKDIEAHVTQWQEVIAVKPGQEQEDPDSSVPVPVNLYTGQTSGKRSELGDTIIQLCMLMSILDTGGHTV
jgi:hypothetical protein